MPYFDWDIGESCPVVNAEGVEEDAALSRCGEVSVEVKLFDRVFCLPLFERQGFVDADAVQDFGQCCNVVSYGEWTISVAAVRSFMEVEGFSQSALGLDRDARLFVGTDCQWSEEIGDNEFPVKGGAWEIDMGWLGKGRQNLYGYHVGTDVNADSGTDIVSVCDGTVVAVRHFEREKDGDDLWGNMVAIADGKGHVFNYCHLENVESSVGVGAGLRRGQRIGRLGRSGFESMPFQSHLHFEVYCVRSGKSRFGYDMTSGGRRLPDDFRGVVVGVNPLPYLLAWGGVE